MTKKFEFTGETKTFNFGYRPIVLHRIRAVADFGLIEDGDIGGWLEKEENLSQEGNAWVSDNANVCGDAEVWGNAKVWNNANVYGNAEVFSASHVLVIGAIGSRRDFTTFYRGKDKQIMVKCGCFNDTIDKFLDKVKQTHGNNKHALVYQKAAELAKIQIDLSCEPQESEE